MRIEILIFIIAAFLMANIYTDGKYLKMLQGGKKYYTLHDDYQFPVKPDYPNAQGWENV